MKQVYNNLGYSAHHTPLSGYQGADLVLSSNEGIIIAVQLKNRE
jgi:HJR/Mrr/RecB family endonuclease